MLLMLVRRPMANGDNMLGGSCGITRQLQEEMRRAYFLMKNQMGFKENFNIESGSKL
jgi:hypothetical protein